MDDVFLEATGKVRDKPRKRRGGWRALLGMGD
jgi:hypothetical protein